jgi:CheY-like chemotaxis protein
MRPLRTIRLLVVEERFRVSLSCSEGVCRPQEKFRWKLSIAQDGQTALDVVFGEEAESDPLPDLVLLDWNLPKVTGSEVLRRIKDHSKLRRMPVLVFSSSEAEGDVHTAYDSHANGYITKPRTAEALEAVMESLERFWIAIARLPKVARAA